MRDGQEGRWALRTRTSHQPGIALIVTRCCQVDRSVHGSLGCMDDGVCPHPSVDLYSNLNCNSVESHITFHPTYSLSKDSARSSFPLSSAFTSAVLADEFLGIKQLLLNAIDLYVDAINQQVARPYQSQRTFH